MLSSKDFMKPCIYNLDTKNQLWCSIIADSHDSTCGCKTPFAHLLASLFPPGHTDRNKTIEEILQRDYKELCLSGGEDAKGHGLPTDTELTGDAARPKRRRRRIYKRRRPTKSYRRRRRRRRHKVRRK